MVKVPENYYDQCGLEVGKVYKSYRIEQSSKYAQYRKYFGNGRWGASRTTVEKAEIIPQSTPQLTNRVIVFDFPLPPEEAGPIPLPPELIFNDFIFNELHYNHLVVGSVYGTKRIDKPGLGPHYRRYCGDGQWSIGETKPEHVSYAPFPSNRWKCYVVEGPNTFPQPWIDAAQQAYKGEEQKKYKDMLANFNPKAPPDKPLRFINRKSV